MRPDEFQDKLRLLTWANFEKFVADVLRGTGRFRDVRQRLLIDSGMGYVRDSTVVMWSGHIGSDEDHAPLLGNYLHKDLVNWGSLG
jgi:hypothetical protein